MKKLIALPCLLLCVFSALAQSPQAIPYQAVLRNADGSVIANQAVTITFTIHNNAVDGTTEYQENHSTTSNALGLINLNVGQGTPSVGPFSAINWGSGTKFLQIAMNSGNGNIDLGTQQMLSVPYALFANNTSVFVSSTGDSLSIGGHSIIVPGISLLNNQGTVNSSSHTCGAINVHNPNLTYGTVIDQEGNSYKTIVIGTQEWMAENLVVSIYRNGDIINSIQNPIGGTWQYPGNTLNYACPYGKQYNWFAVSDLRELCPLGWHVPNDNDWSILENYVANNGNALASNGVSVAGTSYWNNSSMDPNNLTGFSALPGGLGDYYISESSWFWSLTANSNSESTGWLIASNFFGSEYGMSKTEFLSVRCLKN